ncbi:hypothetical protein E1181_21400 [Saccharopolyspora terrae]|uniref:GIY-YIG nuclease family protein n=1 Tax=Saccharopolyspora terrae TaxID=2530384 RepID=A0A4R4VLS2_9PSEU|nr:hypothetical protein E1181_21400 [Saccharopolyspora terrae]
MTPDRYAGLARLAGPWLEEYRDCPILLDQCSGSEQRAVYVVVNEDGRACYCGKTRPTRVLRHGAAVIRLRQHTRLGSSKREEWAAYWVLPLLPETPDTFVDWLERTIAARLGLPLRNRHWRRNT